MQMIPLIAFQDLFWNTCAVMRLTWISDNNVILCSVLKKIVFGLNFIWQWALVIDWAAVNEACKGLLEILRKWKDCIVSSVLLLLEIHLISFYSHFVVSFV